MNCERSSQLIQAALDGELSPGGWADLQGHFQRCPACRRAWNQYRAMAAGWQRLASGSEVPTAKALAVRPASRAPGPAGRRPAWWCGVGAVAAAVVLAMFLGRLAWLDRGGTVVVEGPPPVPGANRSPETEAPANSKLAVVLSAEPPSPGTGGAGPVDVHLVGESTGRYIALAQPSSRPQIHLVWLYAARPLAARPSNPASGTTPGGGRRERANES